jgi:hypothetical protein
MRSSRGRSGGRATGRWSCGSGDVGFRSAGSSRGNRTITSSRSRTLLQSLGVGVFSFFLILARVRTLGVLSIGLLLRLADVPDKGFGVGIIHIAVGQLLPTPDMFRIRGLDGSFAHSAQSLQVNFLIPGEEISESFVSSHPCTGIPPLPEANLRKLQITAKINGVSRRYLSRPEGGMCFLSAKEKIFSIRCHGLFAGLQSDQLFRHVPVGRVNRNIPFTPVHLQSPLNVFDGSGKHG